MRHNKDDSGDKNYGGGVYSYLACHISTVSQQASVYCFTHGLSIQLYIKTVPRRRFSRENKIQKMCTAIQRSGYQHNISTVSPVQLNTKIQITKVYDQIVQAHYIIKPVRDKGSVKICIWLKKEIGQYNDKKCFLKFVNLSDVACIYKHSGHA